MDINNFSNSDLERKFSDLKIKRVWALYLIVLAAPVLINSFYSGEKLLLTIMAINFILTLFVSTQLVLANKKIGILYEHIRNEKK